MNIDLDLLKKQKRTLVDLRDIFSKKETWIDVFEDLSGIIHFLDAVQDEMEGGD